MKRRVLLIGAVVTALLAAAPAGAVEQLKGLAGCVGGRKATVCARSPYDIGPQQPVADPSDRFVYGITRSAGAAAVAAFARASNGGLHALPRPGGCVRRRILGSSLAAACRPARGLRSPVGLLMTPQGSQIYALTAGSLASGDGGVVTLTRAHDGTLSQPAGAAGCITQKAASGCARGRALTQPRRMAMSTDGRSIYVASASGGVAVLTRRSGGGLTQVNGEAGCVISVLSLAGSSCSRVPVPNASSRDVAVSPDGQFVYVVMGSHAAGAIAVYRRSPGTGTLTFASCLADAGEAGCTIDSNLGGARALAISPRRALGSTSPRTTTPTAAPSRASTATRRPAR